MPIETTSDTGDSLRDKLGVCQWFHYECHRDVEEAVELLLELGVKHLRTGISWADYHRPGGKAWYDWQMKQLAPFELLMSIWHTPPSISERGRCNSPPRRLRDYADFIWLVIQDYGDAFDHLELWNEPNNRYKWNFVDEDPAWAKFGAMIAMAGHTAHLCGKQTVLGGMIPVDAGWLGLMRRYGALEGVDVVAIHGFPGMWWPGQICWESESAWRGWHQKIAMIQPASQGRPIWITETGLATVDLATGRPARRTLQCQRLRQAASAPTQRIYWYCLQDLPACREAIEGFHVDENEYHLGLVTEDGTRKPAFYELQRLLAEPAADVSGTRAVLEGSG